MSDPAFDVQAEALLLPRRARVGLALGSARRVLDVLAPVGQGKPREKAHKALEHGWRWILRERYDLHQVHETIGDSLLVKLDDEKQAAALRAVSSALFCVYRFSGQGPGGTDVEELTDEILRQTLDAAASAGDPDAERGWQRATVEKLRASTTEPPESLGAVVRPRDFGFPRDDLDEKREASRSRKQDRVRIAVGQVLEGTVVSVLPDRAVVCVGTPEDLGYLLLEDIADPPPATVSPKLKKGQAVRVKVLKAGVAGSFPFFGLKQLATATT